MNLTFFSDTHRKHKNVACGEGDILFHCGDFTGQGDLQHVAEFAHYMKQQKFRYKVVIAGNHDFCLENELKEKAEKILADHGLIYLNDSGVELLGMKVWGSPIQPWFHNWAFNRNRGSDIREHWDLIPTDTDILLTHGPPFHILDKTLKGDLVGCEDLLEKVKSVKPRIHAFGHIHEAYGIKRTEETIFINSSIVDIRNRCKNEPIFIKF